MKKLAITFTSEFELQTLADGMLYLVSVNKIYGEMCYIGHVDFDIEYDKAEWHVYHNLNNGSEGHSGKCSSILSGKRQMLKYLRKRYQISR